jgi:16S rRNA (adenine1518-N6/adenine1519-N6)-dimethyltransferase
VGARYGQHFLSNPRAVAAILERFGAGPDDAVVEIGPGRGALTMELQGRAGAFAAVEIDPELALDLSRRMGAVLLAPAGDILVPATPVPGSAHTPPPESAFSPRDEPRRYLVLADALDVRYETLASLLGAGPERRLRVIGNLPYSVATALIQRLLDERDLVSDAMFMVQREVADRLLAPPGGKEYGYLTVQLALVCARSRVIDLGPGSFSPHPKVRSSVLALRFPPPGAGFRAADARLRALLSVAFRERRKKLATTLTKTAGIPRGEVEASLKACVIPPDARVEAVPPEALARLAARLDLPAGRETKTPGS